MRGRDADNAETKISEPSGKEREEMIILLRCLDAGKAAAQTLRDILDGTSLVHYREGERSKIRL
jgi:hypothetical protein